jgi:hypothetical protein
MTDAEKIAMVQTLVENDAGATEAVVTVYLSVAANKMLERLYPYDTTKQGSDIPVRYDTLQCELAARLFLRRGAEGETSHEENGVNRAYGTVDDDDILLRLTPFAKVGG